MHEGKNNYLIMVVLALGFALVALAIVLAPQFSSDGVTISPSGEVQRNTIAVTGQAQFDVDPDQAEIYIRMQTKEPTAKRAQEENSRIMNTVKEALKKNGVSDSDMETTDYNMWPQQRWNPTTQKSEDDGFMVQHLLKVKTKDVTKVGNLLDIAVKAGANGLDRVQFTLSDKKRSDVNGEALAQASGNAKSKAEAISQGLGVSLGKIASVSESNVGYDYYYPRVAYAMAEGAYDSKATPSISPESVRVSATINIVYQIN